MKMKKIDSVRRCRLCACEEDLNDFCNIFEENSALDIEMKITKLLPVVVMPWDPMPHKVCHSCIDKLNSFDEFYEGCLRAERFLRTLHPSAPDRQLQNFDPIVEVLEPSPMLDKTFAGVPQKRARNRHNSQRPPPDKPDGPYSPYSPDIPDIPDNPRTPRTPDGDPKRTLSCFIVNELTSRDCIFTCRQCFRTFTKESSALTHTCVRLEDCQELRAIDGGKGQEKSLPPLKIRLFSMRSGLFVCYLCQAPFEDKKELVSHIKGHFEEGSWDEGGNENVLKQRRKRRGSVEDEEWANGVRKRANKKKKRKCSGPGRKRPRRKTTDSTGSSSSFVTKEAADSSRSQYSDVLSPVSAEATFEQVQQPRACESEAGCEKDVVETREDETGGRSAVGVEDAAAGDNSEEVTVIEVVNKKSPTSFSSCIFCDKIFATNSALVAHQKKHLRGYWGVDFEEWDPMRPPSTGEEKQTPTSCSYTFLCNTCSMTFTSKKTLLEHEQYHLVDMEAIG